MVVAIFERMLNVRIEMFPGEFLSEHAFGPGSWSHANSTLWP
jgi:hypothetical protein